MSSNATPQSEDDDRQNSSGSVLTIILLLATVGVLLMGVVAYLASMF